MVKFGCRKSGGGTAKNKLDRTVQVNRVKPKRVFELTLEVDNDAYIWSYGYVEVRKIFY